MRIDLANPVSNHPLNAGLGLWCLPLRNNSGGRTLFDLCGKTHGTLTNGPTWGPGRSPEFGAVQFDGVNDYVDCGTASATQFTPTDPFSVSFWMRTSTSVGAGVTRGIVGRWVSSLAGWFIAVNTQKIYFQLQQSGSVYRYRLSNTSVTDGVPRIVTCTYDGSTNATGMRIFLNGAEDAYSDTQSAGTLTSMAASTTLQIGRRSDGLYYTGTLGEVRIETGDVGSAVSRQALLGYPDLLRRLPTRRSFVGTAGGGGGSAIIPIVQHLNRMRRAG